MSCSGGSATSIPMGRSASGRSFTTLLDELGLLMTTCSTSVSTSMSASAAGGSPWRSAKRLDVARALIKRADYLISQPARLAHSINACRIRSCATFMQR